MLLFFTVLRWLRYFIVGAVLFNFFQGLRFSASDNALLGRRNSTLSEELRPTFAHNPDLTVSTTEKVSFESRKSHDSKEVITRTGLLTRRPNAKGTVLICHGFLCNKYDITFLRIFFSDYNCLIFDFRAHGERIAGQSCTFGKNEALDVIAAANYLKSRADLNLGTQKLFGYGFSMGAVSLIEAQARKPIFDALILDSPFDSSYNIISQGLDRFTLNILGYKAGIPGSSYIKRYAFSSYTQPILKLFLRYAGMDATQVNTHFAKVTPAESIKKITVPCFFITCKNDKEVLVKNVRNVYKSAPGFKQMWVTGGRGHCDSFFFDPEGYRHRANRFLEKCLRESDNATL